MFERHFDEELKGLEEKILYMGSVVESMIHNALNGLKQRQESFLIKVFEQEKDVNRLHIEIDDLCLKLMALRQPMARDLRFITAVMKINGELERMGDQAVNISENTQEFIKQPDQKMLINIEIMSEIVKKMVKDALDAFVKKDTNQSQKVLLNDDEVDNLKAETFKELVTNLKSGDSDNVGRTFVLVLISRNLEKIADHTTNICEDIIFMVLGKDIRHHHIEASKL